MSQASERLAKLEGQMEIFLKLLEEIREDVKDQLSKDEIERLENQIRELKDEIEKIETYYDVKLEKVQEKQHKMDTKLAGTVALLSIGVSLVTTLLGKVLSDLLK